MRKIITIVVLAVVILAVGWQLQNNQNQKPENLGNEAEKKDLIRITSPRPNDVIKSPLVIEGEARGNWYFEASFPLELRDSNGKVIAQLFATAEGEWMTTEFVPFKSTLEFQVPDNSLGSNNGMLILRKDNASGLLEHDDALEVPIKFE